MALLILLLPAGAGAAGRASPNPGRPAAPLPGAQGAAPVPLAGVLPDQTALPLTAPEVPLAPAEAPAAAAPALPPAAAVRAEEPVRAESGPERAADVPPGAREQAEALAEPERGEGDAEAASILVFDNAWVDKREARARIGRAPHRLKGDVLTPPGNEETSVVRPYERPDVVVKQFYTSWGMPYSAPDDPYLLAGNELVARVFLDEKAFAPFFEPHLVMPPAFVYGNNRFPYVTGKSRRTVVVMKHFEAKPFEGRRDHRMYPPLSLMTRLFLLAVTLGLADLNGGGLLADRQGNYRLIDTERALIESLPTGQTADTPWISTKYLNDPEDYRPAIEGFRKAFQRPDIEAVLLRVLKKAGVRRVEESVRTVLANVGRMESVLEAAAAGAAKVFLRDAADAGLDRKGAWILSEINKGLHQKDDARRLRAALVQRDALHSLAGALARAGYGVPWTDGYLLQADDLAFVLEHRAAFGPLREGLAGLATDPVGREALERLISWIEDGTGLETPPFPPSRRRGSAA